MANQDDNNNQEIEKVEDVEVETTKNTSDTDNKKQNNDDGYEKGCFICRITSVSAMTVCRKALMQCQMARLITVS